MVILHIASIRDNPCNGICVAVPQHIRAQSQWAEVGFYNIWEDKIPDLKEQLVADGDFCLDAIPGAFSKPDLAVFHDVYRLPYLHIARQLKKQGVPYVIVPHGCLREEAQRNKWLKKKMGNHLLFNRFIRQAAAIHCLSVQEMNSTNFSAKKFVVPNGTVIPNVCKTDFRNQGLQITYIGRLDIHTKGLDLLLDAVLMQAPFLRHCGCRVRLFGPDYRGRYAAVEEMIRERKLEDIVTLQPAVSGADKERVLLDSDLFIQTSRYEGMPMGILEAMAYGLPCILTTGTNLRGFMEENHAGWGAENTAESIAEAIVQAVNDRNHWQEKSANARTAVQQAFDWNRIATKTLEIYSRFTN